MWLIYAVVALLVIVALFGFMNLLTRHTYKLSMDDVAERIRSTIREDLSYGAFDEFYCVPISYDPQLEEIRKRWVEIVDVEGKDPSTWDKDSPARVTETGKAQLQALLLELEKLAV